MVPVSDLTSVKEAIVNYEIAQSRMAASLTVLIEELTRARDTLIDKHDLFNAHAIACEICAGVCAGVHRGNVCIRA